MLHFLISGIATPFITCIPTEVSEHWFKGRQRTVVTAVLGMGDCFGLILGNNHIFCYNFLIGSNHEHVPN